MHMLVSRWNLELPRIGDLCKTPFAVGVQIRELRRADSNGVVIGVKRRKVNLDRRTLPDVPQPHTVFPTLQWRRGARGQQRILNLTIVFVVPPRHTDVEISQGFPFERRAKEERIESWFFSRDPTIAAQGPGRRERYVQGTLVSEANFPVGRVNHSE